MGLRRRDLLVGAAALGTASILRPAELLAVPEAPTALHSARVGAGAAQEGVLVIVTLDGGNDALNTVVPVADPRYREPRGPLALDPDACHGIGDGFALHPALANCASLFSEERFAVVHGVGFDGLDRSHFHCRDVWYAGREEDLGSGWIGRWLDRTSEDPLDAVAVGTRLPLLLRGERRAGALVPPEPFSLPGTAELRRATTAVALPDDRPPLVAAVARSTAELLGVAERLETATASVESGTGLAHDFDVVATLLEADVPTRVFAVELGGFDTHAIQAPTHERLLSELDDALGAFLTRSAAYQPTVLVHSEFGRRVRSNASGGTDHGAAGTVLVAGEVQGGHHGDPPPLDRLDDGDLRTTVAMADVYAAVLDQVLGIDPADVLGGSPRPLKLVA